MKSGGAIYNSRRSRSGPRQKISLHNRPVSVYNWGKEYEMLKFIVGIVFGVIAIIFILQNVQMVEVTFLFWSISMSRSILFFIMLLIGFVLGWGVGSFGSRRKR
jgi:uncharacterized integral membrane protein